MAAVTFTNRAGRVRATGMVLCEPGKEPAPRITNASGCVLIPKDGRPATVTGRSPVPRSRHGKPRLKLA